METVTISRKYQLVLPIEVYEVYKVIRRDLSDERAVGATGVMTAAFLTREGRRSGTSPTGAA
jgi:bifunctional DNA-binding transcriptional regulator/antitoxin component of YhaV-PrlF toxin-antitoxin module